MMTAWLAAGTSDFQLGAFQQLLDQLFPGSIRTFATDPTVNCCHQRPLNQ